MKKIITSALVATMILGLAACGGSKGYTDGTYTATTDGHNGPLTVEVTIADSKITAVELTDHEETDGIYQNAVDGVIPAIIEKQGVKGVDTVAGATVSSTAILKATEDALKQAK